MKATDAPRSDFIRDIIEADLASGKHERVVTRFPPEPNGFLHIGHAKSICLNFGLAEQFGGRCHLRFDDTNPLTEETAYERAIQEDVRWLGFSWGDHLYHSSDYFERLYRYAEELIQKGLAYVCSLSEEDMRAYRGTVTEPGRASPDRDQSAAEALALFRQMRAGAFADGERTLRAKIDMAAANMKLRDPPLYRIRHAHHHRAQDAWCIYPMYDFAHCLSDSLEGITHSICTLEFENNRALYDWLLDHLDVPRPQPRQYEFARLNLSYTVMSKRKLLTLVREGFVEGWDDPRMPTLSGLRRRGVTPAAIRAFADDIGVAKANSMVEVERFEHFIREDLERRSPRALAVLRPLKVTVETLPEGETLWLEAPYWPNDAEGPSDADGNRGAPRTRQVPLTRTLYIERDDFMEEPVPGFRRLAPGREARLRFAFILRCERVIKDPDGTVVELICSHDPDSRSGGGGSARKVSSTLHWVSAEHAVDCEVRLYDRLFSTEKPDADKDRDFRQWLNPSSLEVVQAKVERSLATAPPGCHFQFERQGYFYTDPKASKAGAPVFNRATGLRDTWAKKAAPHPTSAAPRRGPTPARRPTSGGPPAAAAPVSERARQLQAQHGLAEHDARVLDAHDGLMDWFQEGLATGTPPAALAKWLVNDVQAALKERDALPFGGAEVGDLAARVAQGALTTSGARAVFERMVQEGGTPATWIEQLGLDVAQDEAALDPVIEGVLADHPDEVSRYREGKKALVGFFVGQVMRRTGGKADAKAVQARVVARLAAH